MRSIKLSTFSLRGWEMSERGIACFLNVHAATLTDVSFVDCNVLGEWRNVFGFLYNFNSMR
jgi:hypothetical protein